MRLNRNETLGYCFRGHKDDEHFSYMGMKQWRSPQCQLPREGHMTDQRMTRILTMLSGCYKYNASQSRNITLVGFP